MNNALRILVLEDEPEHVQLVKMLLEHDQLAFELCHVMTERDFLEALDQFQPHIVLADYGLPEYDGLSAVAAVRERTLDVPVIIVSGQMGEEFAVESLKCGAADYVLKTNLQRLPSAVRRAAREREQQLAYHEAQAALRRAHDELEQRVKTRTTELMLANSSLIEEIETRRRTERELIESRTLITAVFASLFGNVAVLDRTGAIIAVNETWLRFAEENGGQKERLGPGVNYLGICRSAAQRGDVTAGSVLAGMEAVLTGATPEFSAEYACDGAGPSRWFRMVVTPLKRPEGGAIVTHMDITRHREAELQVQRLSQDLAHVGRVSMAGELAGALAHELRQPLTAILSNTEAGLDVIAAVGIIDVPELHGIMTDIATSAQRAAEVIRRLRALFRKGPSELQPLELDDLVREILPILRGQATLHAVTLLTELAPKLPRIRGDRIQLEQVLMNLIINAIDALKTAPHSSRRLTIRTSLPTPGWVELSVQDTGIGIPQAHLDRIFESFFTTKPAGMGMGLSICRSIAQAHGGRIWAENNPGPGATMHLQLPTDGAPDGPPQPTVGAKGAQSPPALSVSLR